MKQEITFKEINGTKIAKLRGGRATKIHGKRKYSRKKKHKNKETS